MKVKLAAKNQDINDQDPAGYPDIQLKGKENKIQQQE